MQNTLADNAVRIDHNLERKAERSRADLAEHRWHWTLDASNEQRVSARTYAKAVGKGVQTILDMAQGYDDWRSADGPSGALSEYLARAKLRGNDRVAIEAVASAKGVKVDTARKHYAQEVRAVRATAEERAARRGTAYEDEVKPTADRRATQAKATKGRKADAAGRTNLRLMVIEGKIAAAMRYLRSALEESEGVVLSPEDAADIADQVARLKAIANLLEVRLVGTSDVDWDAEMAKLVDGVQG